MQEITQAEYDHRMRENKASSTPVFDMSNVKIKGQSTVQNHAEDVPQFWILAWDSKGELEESEGFWTKEQREERAIGWLESGWTVTYSTAALQAVRRIEEVLQYWRDMRQTAEYDLREHAEANPTGCPVGCEQCANLLKAYDATLTPSERAEGERKTEQANFQQAQEVFPWLQPEASPEVRQNRFKALQAEWIDLQVSYQHLNDDQLKERHGRWLYNLSDADKRIWDEFITN